jgi:hypothetical protein
MGVLLLVSETGIQSTCSELNHVVVLRFILLLRLVYSTPGTLFHMRYRQDDYS